MFALLTIALLATGACTRLPPLDETVDAAAKSAPYPDLIASDQLLGALATPQIDTETDEAALQARGDRLRARAKRLSQRKIKR